jgi:hypothetical protein
MKNSTLKISLVLVIMALIMPGCLDIWITTQVNSDGSLVKTLAFQGDSAEIAEVRFACLKEEGWKQEWSKPEKDKHKLQISKEFKSVKELNESMNPADTTRLVIRTNSVLHRKFRWFFTRYVYEETVLQANPFRRLDYHKFLSDDELRLIGLQEESREADPEYDSLKYKETEKRFEDFLLRSMYEDFHQTLLSVLNDDHSLKLTAEEVNSRKEEIFHFLVDSVKGDSPEEILTGIGKKLNTTDIELIKNNHLNRFDGFRQRMEFFNVTNDDNYKFATRLPGILLETNSTKIEGAQAGWDLSYYDFFFRDYRMTAESRMVNSWAFIVAGMVVLAALGGMAVSLRNRRRR